MLLKVTLIVVLLIHIVAIVLSWRLISRTKYNAIWILCIFAIFILAGGVLHYFGIFGGNATNEDFMWFGVAISITICLAIIFAYRLNNYADRLIYQRQLIARQILSAVIRAEEHSRLEFAKELHDGLGPLLSSAKMSLSALNTESLAQYDKNVLSNIQSVINESIRSVREISNNMSPQVLIDFGLCQAINNFVSRLTSLHKIDIKFDTNLAEQRFDKDIEVIIYRVVCELINNSLKHANCSKIILSLYNRENSLLLNYTDNGCGFDTSTIQSRTKGMGLFNISSRINSIGGSCDIISSPNRGMKANIKVELTQ